MSRLMLRIDLPPDRDYVGALRVLDQAGNVLTGPFRIAALASDQVAAEHGNPTRATTLPFGDPPLGKYSYVGLAATGAKTSYRSDLFGTLPVIVLTGIEGRAALADANGRFAIVIHGGPLTLDGRLRASTGHFRVSDQDLGVVSALVGLADSVSCVCEETSTFDDSETVSDSEDSAFSEEPAPKPLPARLRSVQAIEDLVAYGEYTTPQPPQTDPVFGATASCEIKMPDGTIKSCSESVGMTYTKDQARVQANLELTEAVKKSGGVAVTGSLKLTWSW